MANIKQNMPYFFSQKFPPAIVEFNSQDELLEIPFVKRYRIDIDGKPDEYFHRYSLDKNNLLVEMCGGAGFFVIGFITGDHNLNLPKWGSNDKDTKKRQNSVYIT